MADQTPGSPGRKLRLLRRKVGLSQDGLAAQLGTDKATISQMENNVVALTPQAEAFLASPPAGVPKASPRPARARRQAPAVAEAAPLSDPEAELGQAPREPGEAPPRVEDAAPRAATPPPPSSRPRAGEIAELEAALNKLFAGEAFLVPRAQPDGMVIQVEAVIPGMAQLVGMIDEFDGMVIRTYAPGMARAWAELARENEQVRKILNGLTYGGAYRGVLAASLPAILAIAAHHGAFGLGAAPPPPQPEEQPQAEYAGFEPPPDVPFVPEQPQGDPLYGFVIDPNL